MHIHARYHESWCRGELIRSDNRDLIPVYAPWVRDAAKSCVIDDGIW